MHNVIEVPRSAALCQRAQLLRQQLGDRIAEGAVSGQWLIAVSMGDPSTDRRRDHRLVARQIDSELRKLRRAARAPKRDPANCRGISTTVPTAPKRVLANLQFDSRLVGEPVADPLKDRDQRLGFLVSAADDREVQVLGKAVGLVVALAEAGAALERPGGPEVLVGGYRGKDPAERVVLLDDVVSQLPLRTKCPHLGYRNHEASRVATSAFARRPQRPILFPPPGAPGSSSEIPAETRTSHSCTSASNPLPVASSR